MCLCEGTKGESIDGVFINKLIKSLHPSWLRPWPGSNALRLVPCGGRSAVVRQMPTELQSCLETGGDTTLMVWADCDHDFSDGEALKDHFWQEAQRRGITRQQFDRVVFILAKDRIENWIEFLMTGKTDESREGPRLLHSKKAAEAAKKLAEFCTAGTSVEDMPPSLQWSCRNWRALVNRMR